MNFARKKINEKLEPKIYVACLAAYNNGYLHGAWIHANQDIDSLNADVKKMLELSPIPDAEEFAIHDYAGFAILQSMNTIAWKLSQSLQVMLRRAVS